MPNFTALLPLFVPLLPLTVLVLPSRLADRIPRAAILAVLVITAISFFLAIASAVALVLNGPIHHAFVSVGPVALTVYLDSVSAVMLVLVSFLGTVVALFARNYLGGNPRQGRFFRWIAVTVGSVLLLIVSGNLALFAFAWIATSLSLHQLLTFNRDRPGAILAARKKFVFSRLGDLCLLGAIGVAWLEFATLDIPQLIAVAAGGSVGGVQTIAVLLAAAALLKSAQFPFHGWLPDTMETPTPVSALMHAGIINAGGFLVIRFSPLVALSPAALDTLAVVGAVTALFGSLVMITQTRIKRALAFSTIAQMGFMMLQCGLGAFALALLHIVAHSLYKAHAFLSSGSVIATARAAGEAPPITYRGIRGAVIAFAAAFVSVCFGALVIGETPWHDPAAFALSAILAIALAQLFWSGWAAGTGAASFAKTFLVGIGICALSLALHAGAKALVGDHVAAPPASTIGWLVAIPTALAFLVLALRVFLPPSWTSTQIGRAIWVHAYNGFYVNTAANRVLGGLRPVKDFSK